MRPCPGCDYHGGPNTAGAPPTTNCQHVPDRPRDLPVDPSWSPPRTYADDDPIGPHAEGGCEPGSARTHLPCPRRSMAAAGRRRVAVPRGLRPGLWDVFRAVPYRSRNGPAGRSRDGPRAVAAREEARGLAAPRVRGQAPVPGAAMDWCQWECELTEDVAWKPCRSTT